MQKSTENVAKSLKFCTLIGKLGRQIELAGFILKRIKSNFTPELQPYNHLTASFPGQPG